MLAGHLHRGHWEEEDGPCVGVTLSLGSHSASCLWGDVFSLFLHCPTSEGWALVTKRKWTWVFSGMTQIGTGGHSSPVCGFPGRLEAVSQAFGICSRAPVGPLPASPCILQQRCPHDGAHLEHYSLPPCILFQSSSWCARSEPRMHLAGGPAFTHG